MSDGAAPLLRIAILTHNALHHTKRCIATLQAHTTVPWCALILDNASTDATQKWLSSLDDPRIRVELCTDNLGVGGGRNWLMQQLLPSMHNDELLVFLDNDIEVGKEWAQPFLEAFAERPRLGVAGRWAFSMHVHENWRDILPEHNGNAGPVDTVQGCCFWVRAATARGVGDFDESLGRFWHEDDDFCIRALHAGWDVRRVRSDNITHHEHGSGVALDGERIAGSFANQAYLIRKWRAMGAIDDYGEPRRSVADETQPLRQQLGSRLSRGRPLLRTELSGAIEDATKLLHAAVTDERVAILASPAARMLLADAMGQESGEVQRRAVAAVTRIDAVLAQRRRANGAAIAAPSAGRAFSGVCNPAAWDDQRWAETYRTHFRDGAGADFYSRSEIAWRDGQLMHALRVTNALSKASRVLVVGHASERIIGALTHAAAHVVVLDHQPASIEMIAGSATRTLGNARLTTAVWPPPQLMRDERFDIVLCPNASRYAPAPNVDALLTTLSTFAKSGGHVSMGLSVRLTGPANGRWLERDVLADDGRLARHGLRRIGKFDGTVADETLLAAVPAEMNLHWRPRLSRDVAPHRVTLATLVCRRTE